MSVSIEYMDIAPKPDGAVPTTPPKPKSKSGKNKTKGKESKGACNNAGECIITF